jgi:hypothetical protein
MLHIATLIGVSEKVAGRQKYVLREEWLQAVCQSVANIFQT